MTGQLNLHVVSVGTTSIPPLDALREGFSLERWFSQATAGTLQLRVHIHTPIPGPDICRGDDLHAVLRTILGVSEKRPVDDIGLIFCGSWEGRLDLLGLMFDYDGTYDNLGAFVSKDGVPREGCAVFVDAIGRQNIKRQVFAAVHELGHVFNLHHDPTEDSFMAERRDDVFQFNNADCLSLKAAAKNNWFYAPGGGNFGDFASPGLQTKSTHPVKNLTLRAYAAKQSYLMGEPLVIDLDLQVKTRGTVFVSNTLDPGYQDLDIWVENEHGERCLHRPQHLFCLASLRNVRLDQAQGLSNNPRLFLKHLGPSFDRPGMFRIWADFYPRGIKGRRLTRSNYIELEVKPPTNTFEERLSAVFRHPKFALFLSNKGGNLTSRRRRLLYSLIKEKPRHHALQYARYALGIERFNKKDYKKAAELLIDARPKEPSIRGRLRDAKKQLSYYLKHVDG